MRVWISKGASKNVDDYCAVWIELGDGNLVYILESGNHGLASDHPLEYDESSLSLSDRIQDDVESWERIA